MNSPDHINFLCANCHSTMHNVPSEVTSKAYDVNKSNHSADSLIAYLSHELRNPIQAISTGVYVIEQLIKKMGPKSLSNSTINSLSMLKSDDLNNHTHCTTHSNPNTSTSFIDIDEKDKLVDISDSFLNFDETKRTYLQTANSCGNDDDIDHYCIDEFKQ
jgi:signal transduction histidine kinase